jgi:hypothetical protein
LLKLSFREEAIRRTKISGWFSKFKSGETSINEAGYSGHPFTRKMAQIKELVHEKHTYHHLQLS